MNKPYHRTDNMYYRIVGRNSSGNLYITLPMDIVEILSLNAGDTLGTRIQNNILYYSKNITGSYRVVTITKIGHSYCVSILKQFTRDLHIAKGNIMLLKLVDDEITVTKV